MKIKDLINIREETQKLVRKHLEETGETESGLSKKAGIHPAQLLLFMRNERGLTDSSLSKLGKVLAKK